jgi:hypothetical protein
MVTQRIRGCENARAQAGGVLKQDLLLVIERAHKMNSATGTRYTSRHHSRFESARNMSETEKLDLAGTSFSMLPMLRPFMSTCPIDPSTHALRQTKCHATKGCSDCLGQVTLHVWGYVRPLCSGCCPGPRAGPHDRHAAHRTHPPAREYNQHSTQYPMSHMRGSTVHFLQGKSYCLPSFQIQLERATATHRRQSNSHNTEQEHNLLCLLFDRILL